MRDFTSVLVTGGTGLLGGGIERTKPAGARLVLTHLRDYDFSCGNAECVRADALDAAALDRLFEKHHFSYVVHCAGIANVDYVEAHYEESHNSNCQSTLNAAAACKKHGAHFIYVSTNAVFDGAAAPYGEDAPAKPVNKYGEIKAECEAIAARAAGTSTILRPILMYGWHGPHSRQNPVTWMLSKLRAGQKVPLVNDVYENPLYNIQAGEAVWEIIKRKMTGIIHVAGGEILNRHALGLKVAKTFSLDASLIKAVDSGFFPSIAPRPKNTGFKTARMEKELGLKPLSIEQGLALMKKEEAAHAGR